MGVQSSEQRSAGVYLGRCSRSERPRANLLSRRQSRNMNYSELFQIKPGSEVHLKKIDPNIGAPFPPLRAAVPWGASRRSGGGGGQRSLSFLGIRNPGGRSRRRRTA